MAGGVLSGAGTADSPYLVEDLYDFNAIVTYAAGSTNDNYAYFAIVADIDMSDYPEYANREWKPTEYSEDIYINVEGNGHVLNNFYVYDCGYTACIFGRSPLSYNTYCNANVYNLSVTNLVESGTTQFCVFGYGNAKSAFQHELKNCHVTGVILSVGSTEYSGRSRHFFGIVYGVSSSATDCSVSLRFCGYFTSIVGVGCIRAYNCRVSLYLDNISIWERIVGVCYPGASGQRCFNCSVDISGSVKAASSCHLSVYAAGRSDAGAIVHNGISKTNVSLDGVGVSKTLSFHMYGQYIYEVQCCFSWGEITNLSNVLIDKSSIISSSSYLSAYNISALSFVGFNAVPYPVIPTKTESPYVFRNFYDCTVNTIAPGNDANIAATTEQLKSVDWLNAHGFVL